MEERLYQNQNSYWKDRTVSRTKYEDKYSYGKGKMSIWKLTDQQSERSQMDFLSLSICPEAVSPKLWAQEPAWA